MGKDAPGRWSFLGHRVPPAFAARRLVVPPGAPRAFDEAEWADAVVVVERGEVELECVRGGRRRFRAGDILWLAGLELCALHCCGGEPVVLLSVARRRSDEFPRRGPSNRETMNGREREPDVTHETKDNR
jgi:hypothetical protein